MWDPPCNMSEVRNNLREARKELPCLNAHQIFVIRLWRRLIQWGVVATCSPCQSSIKETPVSVATHCIKLFQTATKISFCLVADLLTTDVFYPHRALSACSSFNGKRLWILQAELNCSPLKCNGNYMYHLL
jgi:hypothetical protein